MESSKSPKGVFTHTFVYSVGNFVARGLSFLLLPFYSHFISPPDFGAYSVIISVMTIASTILNLGLPGIFVRYISEVKSFNERSRFLSIVFNAITLINIPILIVVILFAKSLSKIILDSENYFLEVILGLISIYAINYSYYITIFYIAEEQSKKFVTVNIISATVNFLLNILLVGISDFGIKGILLSQILSSLLVIYLSKEILINHLSFYFDFGFLQKLLITSLPLLLSGIFSIVVELIDRILVLKLLGESEAGIYSFGYRIALVYNLFIISFKSAWIPHFFRLEIPEEEKSKHAGRVLLRLIFLSMIIINVIIAGVKFLFNFHINSLKIFNQSYSASMDFILYILLGYFFSLLISFYSIAPYSKNKTIHFLWSDFLAMIVNLILNLLLIPRLGITGAAIATMFAFACGFIYLFVYSIRNFSVEYDYWKIILLFIMGSLTYVSSIIFENYFLLILFLILLILLSIRFGIIGKNGRSIIEDLKF